MAQTDDVPGTSASSPKTAPTPSADAPLAPAAKKGARGSPPPPLPPPSPPPPPSSSQPPPKLVLKVGEAVVEISDLKAHGASVRIDFEIAKHQKDGALHDLGDKIKAFLESKAIEIQLVAISKTAGPK